MAIRQTTQFPWQLFRSCWNEGITSAFVPKKYGGRGLSMKDTHILADSMKQQPHQMKTIMGAHLAVQLALEESCEQKQERYYPLKTSHPIVSAAHINKFGIQTDRQTAVYRVNKHNNMVLSARNMLFTNADVASFYMVEARDENDPTKSKLFLLDKHLLGIFLEKSTGKDHQREVSFYDVIVTKDNILCDNSDDVMSSISVALEEIMQ